VREEIRGRGGECASKVMTSRGIQKQTKVGGKMYGRIVRGCGRIREERAGEDD